MRRSSAVVLSRDLVVSEAQLEEREKRTWGIDVINLGEVGREMQAQETRETGG